MINGETHMRGFFDLNNKLEILLEVTLRVLHYMASGNGIEEWKWPMGHYVLAIILS